MRRGSGWYLLLGLLSLSLVTACGTAATATVPATAPPPAAASTPTPPTVAPTISVRDPWARPATMAATGMGTPGMATATTGMATPAMGGGAPMGGTPGMGGTPMMTGTSTSAAYMTIANGGGAPDRLTGAASDVAAAIELHTTEVKDNVARMQQVQGIDVPANGEVHLKPGGFHIMLINVRRDLKPGDTFTLTLTFAQAGKVAVAVQVRQP